MHSKTKIDWDSWNRARQFFESLSIMNGEEKQLSNEEIEEVNEHLRKINQLTLYIIPTLNVARERFKNKNR